MGNFNSQWLEIFEAGDYGDKGNWTTKKIDQVVANLEATNPQGKRLHTPMAVFGHPKHDDPAHGAVSALKREGEILLAQFTKTSDHLEKSVQDGRFPNRSAAFYLDPQGKGPVLRHVGFLGAIPPEVKGLAPVQFFDGGEHVTIEFKEEAVSKQITEETNRTIREAVKEFFAELFGKKNDPAGATFTEAQLKERIDAAAQKLQSTFQEKLDGLKKNLEERVSTDDGEKAKLKVSAFIEKQRVAHRWVPAFDKGGLPAVLAHLAGSDATVSFGEGDKKKEVKLYDAFTTFLESLPELVPMGELATSRRKAGKLVQFTEPQNPDSVDPDSIALAERAEALESEIRKENPTFSETEVARLALQRARQGEPTGSISAGKV